ncbi:MAG: hypothetical protein L6R41_005534 [Letrouitia leprolyta]|nr:MAG: hypothetical protein L6R41_005534 [Letrouitia leprolyta]
MAVSTPNHPTESILTSTTDDTAIPTLTSTISTTSISSNPIPLTFGLEFEHILLFHSSFLQALLPPGTQIQKSLPYDTRFDIRQTTSQYQLSRPVYNGWALTSPTTYPSPFGNDWHNECIQRYGVRGYADEGLRMEKAVLERGSREKVNVHNGKGKMKDFSRWHLVTDTSLIGLTEEEIAATLNDLGTAAIRGNDNVNFHDNDIDTQDWDSSPVELVTRVFRLDDNDDDDDDDDDRVTEASFAEINTMVNCLNPVLSYPSHRYLDQQHIDHLRQRQARHLSTVSPHCGLHVHIGTLLPDGFPLPLLQHLAYILTIYEPVLSSLHPVWRRPGHEGAEVDLRGNRECFFEEPAYNYTDDSDFEDGDDRWRDEDQGWERNEMEKEVGDRGRDSGYGSDAFCHEEEKEKKKGVRMPIPITTCNNKAAGCNGEEEEEEEQEEQEKEKQRAAAEEEAESLAFELRIRAKARSTIFHPSTTIDSLVSTLSGVEKGKLVNWLNLKRKDGESPRTIEFRQHEGCLDAKEARHWVEFCARLVRWAGKMAGKWEEERGWERGEEWLEGVYGRGMVGVEELGGRDGFGG